MAPSELKGAKLWLRHDSGAEASWAYSDLVYIIELPFSTKRGHLNCLWKPGPGLCASAWECACWSGPKPCWGQWQQFIHLRDGIPGPGNASWCWSFKFFVDEVYPKCPHNTQIGEESSSTPGFHHCGLFSHFTGDLWMNSEVVGESRNKLAESHQQLIASSVANANCFEKDKKLLTSCLWRLIFLGRWLLGAMQFSQLSLVPHTLDYLLSRDKAFSTHLRGRKSEVWFFKNF